jgi:hypothetical protein
MLNEYEEMRLMVSHSKKMEKLALQFNEMMSTYQRLCMPLPDLFYTENVAGVQAFLKEVISSLLKDVQEKPREHKPLFNNQENLHLLPQVTLPEGVEIIVASNSNENNVHCEKILDNVNIKNGKVFMGFVCE